MAKKVKKQKPFVWVDWEQGAKLKIGTVHFNNLLQKYPEIFDPGMDPKYKEVKLSVALMRESIIGWNDQVQGEDGKILPFTVHTHARILDDVLSSGKDIQSKILTALKGSLGNLTAG